jgi:hypothetical protein
VTITPGGSQVISALLLWENRELMVLIWKMAITASPYGKDPSKGSDILRIRALGWGDRVPIILGMPSTLWLYQQLIRLFIFWGWQVCWKG